ncbi:uncharacterized protein LOC135812742 [Sycon ciliatum]|uniref:uncharacterized protein LOC135812742 n=1 Tax=Sycon ciliatum TaxID=27933 RepID=UPI0020AD0ECB
MGSSFWMVFSMVLAGTLLCRGQCPDKYQRLEMRIEELEAQQRAQKEMSSITASRCTVGEVGYQYQSLHNLFDDKKEGLTATLAYTKKHNSTLLKMTYSLNIAVVESMVVSRWYFQIDGKECVVPTPIDMGTWHSTAAFYHMPAVLTGICESTDVSGALIGAGNHSITVWVGPVTQPGLAQADTTNSGWVTTSFLEVREICPPY